MTPEELATAVELGVCGWPGHYGGVKATQRAGGHRDLGWMWHCNRKTNGGRCWQHRGAQ